MRAENIVKRLPGATSVPDALRLAPGLQVARVTARDWSVTARTNVAHVRDTISDRELEVWALLDVTPSMNWGTEGVTKRDLGIAAIATVAARRIILLMRSTPTGRLRAGTG